MKITAIKDSTASQTHISNRVYFGLKETLSTPVLILIMVFLGFGLAGQVGLEPVFKTVLSNPKVSIWALMVFGLLMLVQTLMTPLRHDRNGEMMATRWISIWEPVRFALMANLFIPYSFDGVSMSTVARIAITALSAGSRWA